MVYLLTRLSTLLSCKAGQTATALPNCPALLSTHATLTTWHRCICMQQVTSLQAVKTYGLGNLYASANLDRCNCSALIML